MSYFSTIGAKTRSLPTVQLTHKSKICLVVIVALTDSFKTLNILGYCLPSIFFLAFGLEFSIVWSEIGFWGSIDIGTNGCRFSTGLHSPNWTFFGVV